jgi:ABC-2 type transport system permease protein
VTTDSGAATPSTGTSAASASSAASGPAPATGGVIHDLGYRRYDGPRLGRPAILRALFWHSLRSAFGFGRGARAKIVPIAMFAILSLPAVVNAVAVARLPGHVRVIPYDTYTYGLRTFVMLIFVAAQAPELVSRDLRNHVLPLYLSRPVRRLDYPLAKYLALCAACLVIIEVPLLILYVSTIVSAQGPSGVWHETRALIPGLGVGLLWAVLLAAIGLLLASFTGRRVYATGSIAIYFFLTVTLAGILTGITEQQGPQGSVAPYRLSGLVSPFTVLDGVRQWLGGTSPGPVPPPGGLGFLYGLMFLALLAVSLGGLAARYAKAGVS